jgi:hypothetical protein
MKKTILAVVFLMFFVSSAFGAEIRANNNHLDIDCSQDDVIKIRQGTYTVGNITVNPSQGFYYSSNQGYSLTLKGGYDATFQNQTLDPQNTILDGGDQYAVLHIVQDNGGDVYVEGLTIQNSNWWNLSGFNVATHAPAPGEVASITIYKNIIQNNKVGGLYVAANDFNGGVGELQTGTITIRENTIYNNSDTGVKAYTFSNNGIASDISLIDNTITDNSRPSGVWLVNTVEIDGGSAAENIIVQGNYIAGNSNPGYQAGGLKVEIDPGTGTAGSIYVKNNTIVENAANDAGGLHIEAPASGTAGISGAEVYLINNIIANNTATNQGGAIRLLASNSNLLGDEGARYLINNTITGNDGDKFQCDGALLGRRADSVYHLYNNIIWDNAETSSDYDVYFLGAAASGTLNIYNNDYSYLYEDGSGTVNIGGNLNANPVFAGAGDYHLTLGSPCIDTGINAAPALPAKDKDGKPRKIDGDGNHTKVVDMGAYEYGDPSTSTAMPWLLLLLLDD